MPHMRLRPEHTVMRKLEKLWDFMQEEGITLGVDHNVITVEVKGEGKTFTMFDNEADCSNGRSQIYSLPPNFEYKVTYPCD